jgi:hypothetical protein
MFASIRRSCTNLNTLLLSQEISRAVVAGADSLTSQALGLMVAPFDMIPSLQVLIIHGRNTPEIHIQR